MSLLISFFYACIINAVINFILGVIVLIKGRKALLNQIWVLFCLSISLWSLGLGFMTNSLNAQSALIWLKYVHYLGLIFLPITFLHFCLIFIDLHNKRKTLILINYILGFLLLIANFFGLLATVKPLYPFNFYTVPYPLYSVFGIVFLFSFIYAFYVIIKQYKHVSFYKKNQIKYFFIGTFIGFVGGSTAFFPMFKLPLFPWGIYSFSIYTLIVSYAIARYHLLDIRFVIKKSTQHLIMAAFISFVYATIVIFFGNYLSRFFQLDTIVLQLLAIAIIAVSFSPIQLKVEKIIDKIFFREKNEYLQTISDFSQSLLTILDLRILMDLIVNNISNLLKIKNVRIFFFDENEKSFQSKALIGFFEKNKILREQKLNNDSHLINSLKIYQNIEIKNKLIKENKNNEYTPVIDELNEINADIAVPLFFDKKLIGVLTLGEKDDKSFYTLEELDLLKSLANQTAIAFVNANSYNKIKNLHLETIDAFVKAIEAKDKYTEGHSYRVVEIATKLAIENKMSRDEIELLKYAGILHDIGKIGVDDNILNKVEVLSEKEFEEIRKHPVIGNKIVSSIKYLSEAAKIILYHHERWDGTGYPAHLKGEEIPVLSRIISVADSYDSMTTDRSYRKALKKEDAVNELKTQSGKQFDPDLVNIFIECYEKNLID